MLGELGEAEERMQQVSVQALGMWLSLPIFPTIFRVREFSQRSLVEAVVASRTSHNLLSSIGVTLAGLSHFSSQFFAWNRVSQGESHMWVKTSCPVCTVLCQASEGISLL